MYIYYYLYTLYTHTCSSHCVNAPFPMQIVNFFSKMLSGQSLQERVQILTLELKNREEVCVYTCIMYTMYILRSRNFHHQEIFAIGTLRWIFKYAKKNLQSEHIYIYIHIYSHVYRYTVVCDRVGDGIAALIKPPRGFFWDGNFSRWKIFQI